MHQSRRILVVASTTLILLLGCGPLSSVTIGKSERHSVRAEKSHGGGPPPHAPAHGYRHKQPHHGQSLELVFDSDIGAYLVVGLPNHYYWNGYYLRIDGNQWYASVDLDGGWERRSDDALPSGMKRKKHPKAKRGNSRKSSPAKGRW